MWIFAGVPINWRGRQMRVELKTTAILGDLSGYRLLLGNLQNRPAVLYGDMILQFVSQ